MPTNWAGSVAGGPATPVYVVGSEDDAVTPGADVNVVSTVPIPAGINNIGDVDVLTIPDSKESWRVSLQIDENVMDSDKTFTVPALTEWQILWIWVELATTATVGNRQMAIELQDAAADVIGVIRADFVQAASLTRYYMFAPGLSDLSSLRDTNWLSTPIPNALFLSAGQKIRIWDNKAIAAAGDTMTIQMQIASRAV